ncbi:VOC family protein [Teredinibacter turnerae]|uniref:Glyoxalase family protein n=1 Tax=Teredinibacter turnerae (strain ATCC 39867 / T7901) TaxID=377629 RepID=C5BM59_TERTT|nr:VOC family protein [Teredinibacter turnerae]ACR11534.1 glyoxalase family protein [Teredinibacter turnerae T7901]
MNPRISMITLGVKDLQKSVAFYEKGLGFPRIDSSPGVAFFSLNGTWLGLYNRDALAEDIGIEARGNGFNGVTLAHNVASNEQVDDVMAQAEKAGANIIKPAQTVFWGGYSGYFKDLDNHFWEVAHNPFLWIGPED